MTILAPAHQRRLWIESGASCAVFELLTNLDLLLRGLL